MARNGSGTFSVANTFTANTTAQSSAVNANFTDVGAEITNSLPRDGQAGMTGQFKAANGTAALPGISFGSDTNSGFYRKAGDVIGVVVGGTEVGTFASTGFTGETPSEFAAGTAMIFAQTAAPTGWTKATTLDNAALRLTTGTVGTGGSTVFTSVFAARTIAASNLPEHTHPSGTLGGTATSTGSAHQHGVPTGVAATASVSGQLAHATGSAVDLNTSSGDGAHTHSLNITGSTAVNNTANTAMDFAVKYQDVILATKD